MRCTFNKKYLHYLLCSIIKLIVRGSKTFKISSQFKNDGCMTLVVKDLKDTTFYKII